MSHRIDALRAPLLVAWQLTRDCDLACLHCCTESAPGKALPDELTREQALRVAGEIAALRVPYVMLCGGEPLVCPYFPDVVRALGDAGVQLKIETNGQRLDASVLSQLRGYAVRSVQVSLDGDTQDIYGRQRIGGSLARAHAACRAVVAAGLPLEVTFAPTRVNIHEAGAVIRRARELGAFRFNTGALMRVGTAARHWTRLQPDAAAYQEFRALLERESRVRGMEICFEPFTLGQGLQRSARQPPATLLVLPNGLVKVAAALPHVCGDLRRTSLEEAWRDYRRAWHSTAMLAAAADAIADEEHHGRANAWCLLPVNV